MNNKDLLIKILSLDLKVEALLSLNCSTVRLTGVDDVLVQTETSHQLLDLYQDL